MKLVIVLRPFQQFVNNDVRLPGPLLSSHRSVRASDTLPAKTDGRPWVTRGWGRGTEKLNCSSKSSPRAQEQCGPCVVLQDYVFLPSTCVSQCTRKLLNRLEVRSNIVSSCGKYRPVCIFPLL